MFESGSSIVPFGPGLGRDTRDDICDLLLYADGFASHAYSRELYWNSWLHYHQQVLQKHCCKSLSVVSTPTLFIHEVSELDSINLNITSYDDPQRLFELAGLVLQTLGIHAFAERFFRQGQAGDRVLSWQVAPCEINAHGEIILMNFGLSLRTKMGERAGGSSGPLDREIVLKISGGVYVFDADAYAAFFRQQVRDRLRDKALGQLIRMEL